MFVILVHSKSCRKNDWLFAVVIGKLSGSENMTKVMRIVENMF